MTRPDRDVLLCRACCCGTAKHPRTDHDAQVDALRDVADASEGRVRVRVVDCLSECERSNVVLVRDFTRARRPLDTWLGGVLDDDATGVVADWVRVGGARPADLDGHVFAPGRR